MRVLLALLFFCSFLTSAFAQSAIRPGDGLEISVWQDPKLDRRVVVAPDGMIGFPLVGQIRAAGLTPQALEQVLRERLAKNYTGQLDVTVALAAVNKEYEDETKPKVYITGEVLRPGPYFVRPDDQCGAGDCAGRRPGAFCSETADSASPQSQRCRFDIYL